MLDNGYVAVITAFIVSTVIFTYTLYIINSNDDEGDPT